MKELIKKGKRITGKVRGKIGKNRGNSAPHEHENENGDERKGVSLGRNTIDSKNLWMWIAIILAGTLIFTQLFEVKIEIRQRGAQEGTEQTTSGTAVSDKEIANAVIPGSGVVLPVRWGDLGEKMVKNGIIDSVAFEKLYATRGGLSDGSKQLLYGKNNGNLKIDTQNSGVVLNLLWAFGLSNKNAILENGPMQDPKYGGAGRFASTGGWTLAKGNAMNYYGKYAFVSLTPEQQALVEKVSRNIYRPCCGNSVYFPDCNHGMAMLGLLELLASQGANETQMYATALKANSYWFPSTYVTIAKYFAKRGVAWNDVDPKEALGSLYSSASGYKQVLSEVEPVKSQGGGGGCGA